MWRYRPALPIAALLSALVSILAPSFSRADTPPAGRGGVTIDVRGGFDGYYKVGGWLPISALAGNEGPPLTARISLTPGGAEAISGTYGATIDLPTHSQKQVAFAAPAIAAERTRAAQVVQAGKTLWSTTLDLSPLSPQDYLFGVIGPASGALDGLRGARLFDGTIAVAHMRASDLPGAGVALNDVDALILEDTPTAQLPTDVRQILKAWVASGGQLILAGGPGAAPTLDGLPDLVPVALGGPAVVDLGAALATWGIATGQAPAEVAVGRPREGSVVRLRAGDIPLVVDRPFGRGWVTYLAAPASAPTLSQGPVALSFWTRLLTGSRHPLAGVTVAGQPRSAGPRGGTQAQAIYSLQQAGLPAAGDLAWLVLTYIGAVGPLNYLVLKRLDRRELLWLTIPLVSLVFSVGSYALARRLKGADLVVSTVTVIHHAAQAPVASVDGALGLFSPGRTTYDLRLGGGYAVGPLDLVDSGRGHRFPLITAEGRTLLLQGIHVDQWTLQTYGLHGEADAAAPLETSLTLAGTTVTGSVRNRGDHPLDTVIVAVGGATALVPRLNPGEQQPVQLDLGAAPSNRPLEAIWQGVPTTDAERQRQTLLMGVLGEQPGEFGQFDARGVVGGAQAFAFSDVAPSPVDIPGQHPRRQDLTLHVVDLALSSGGATAAPYGAARYEVLQNTGIRDVLGAPGLPLGSSAVVQFYLPAGGTWTSLHLRFALGATGRAIPAAPPPAAPPAPGLPNGLTFSLFNWASGTWDAQAGAVNGSLTVPSATSYVDPRGLVRVRIEGGNGQQALRVLDLAASGSAG